MKALASIFLTSLLLSVAGMATAADIAPRLDAARGGKCVEDPKFMRMNHMKLITHQRDETLRQGIRGGKYSLAECVNCHASKTNDSVLGSKQNFCQGCHQYAAVKIDCFECHSSKPRTTQTVAANQTEAEHAK